jgi:hypothetical protein
MTQLSDPNSNPRPSVWSHLVLPFAAYLFTFVGMGLVAGSVVHFGETDQIPRFLTIGLIGMGLFIVSSYLQEVRLNTSSMPLSSIIRYVFYSLILAVGIGMISGGTQHFLDFPIYASYLLPVGFILALVAYVLRNQLTLTRKGWSWLLGGALLLALPTFLGLNLYAQALPVGGGHSHGDSHAEMLPMPLPSPVNQGAMQQLKDGPLERAYVEGMIDHHQETIAMAKQLQKITKRSELKTMAANIIRTQQQEVSQLQALLSSLGSSPEQQPDSAPPGHSDHSGHSH